MLHNYRKIDPVKAEQFDGSLEMMEKYHITDDGSGETYTFRLGDSPLPLERGWWIVYEGTSEVLGITLVHWRTMSDEKFRQTYREEESNGESIDKSPTGSN
ncbi:hypothetical protein [Limosilactobacillus fermentum]|uniref:hypothetical protein n=1 Tax=Limosilactobacillus fermentum TaxID=1613 RepID=UPI0006669554|nr:hypothetical protein [Limosilactobacillus fermentum]DAO15776.1 MAG TPA: hypothetical protein [Caudoviricetes sp.]